MEFIGNAGLRTAEDPRVDPGRNLSRRRVPVTVCN